MVNCKYNIINDGLFSGRCVNNDFDYDKGEGKEKGIKYYKGLPGLIMNILGKAKYAKGDKGESIYLHKKSFSNWNANHQLKSIKKLETSIDELKKDIPDKYKSKCENILKEAKDFVDTKKKELNESYFRDQEEVYHIKVAETVSKVQDILKQIPRMKTEFNNFTLGSGSDITVGINGHDFQMAMTKKIAEISKAVFAT